MKKTLLAGLISISVIACVSCSKTEEPEPEPEPKEQTVFSFTDTNTIVKAQDIKPVSETSTVKADFNLDGGEDIAVVDKDEEGKEVVSLYIQTPVRDTAAAKALEDKSYFRAGAIVPPEGATIRGVMSRRRENYTDLLILYAYDYKDNETIHYRNDGTKFTLVSEE